MTTYALLLNHAPDRYDNVSDDEFMAIIKDYVAWVEEMTTKGIYKGGHKLSMHRSDFAEDQLRTNKTGSTRVHAAF